MIVYAIRNKKTKKYVFGFDYRYNPPYMRYIKDELYQTPKLLSKFDISQDYVTKQIPKCCELVKVEIKEIDMIEGQ